LQLIYGSDVSGLRCDYDEEHKRLSPGCLLQMRIMRKNIEQGCAEYDFCGDNDGYKSSWVDQVRDHRNLTVYNATFAAAMVRLWDFGLVYRLKTFLKQSGFLRSLKRRITLGKA
jgi:CelD/BcsL family acetyltransferase involved in cellulose biosynthesis